MTPEAADQLAKARQHLVIADKLLELKIFDAAGRSAYMAAFAAARGYVFALTGQTVKTHSGLQDRFYTLVKDDPKVEHELAVFMSRAYRLKAIADYEVGPAATVPPDIARDAVGTAVKFVALIDSLLTDSKT